MDCYHCEICDMFTKTKNKSKHFKSNRHKTLDKHKHIKLSIDNLDLNNIEKKFYTYIDEYNNKFEFYLVRCEIKLVFINMESYPLASNKLTNKKTMVSWKIFVENIIIIFKIKGFDFSHISQMIIIIVCNKMDMTYDVYMKHNKPAVEWRLNAMIVKNKSLINKVDRNWIHPLNRKFESYRV